MSADRRSCSAATRTGCASRASSRGSVIFGRRVPEEVRRRVLARRVVGDRVELDVARRDEELKRRAAGVQRVDEDAAEIRADAADVVVIAERRANQRRLRIVELEGGIERLVVVGEVADARDRRRRVVARLALRTRSRSASPSATRRRRGRRRCGSRRRDPGDMRAAARRRWTAPAPSGRQGLESASP